MAKELFERALKLAITAHKDQTDLGGHPYILHPIRLAAKCSFDPILRAAAILHDVVEDSELTVKNIKAIMGPEIASIVDCLSRRALETYGNYIKRIITNPFAIKIKLLDLEDNINVLRIRKVDEKHRKRLNMYIGTHRKLTKYLFK